MTDTQTLNNNFHLLEIADAREKMKHLRLARAEETESHGDLYRQEYLNPIYDYMINAIKEHIEDMEQNAVHYIREGDKEWNKQVMGLRRSLVEMYRIETALKWQLKKASNHAFYASLSIILLLFCLVFVIYNSSSTL